MTLTDEELDRDWVPSGRRPQSTIARSFSQELMDIFRIDNSVDALDDKIKKQKQKLSTRTTELEAIEARIREMDERLQRSRGDTLVSGASPTPNGTRQDGVHAHTMAAGPSHQLPHHQRKEGPPPGDSKAPILQHQNMAPGSGAMPPTPSASEDGHE